MVLGVKLNIRTLRIWSSQTKSHLGKVRLGKRLGFILYSFPEKKKQQNLCRSLNHMYVSCSCFFFVWTDAHPSRVSDGLWWDGWCRRWWWWRTHSGRILIYDVSSRRFTHLMSLKAEKIPNAISHSHSWPETQADVAMEADLQHMALFPP